jgi:diguanylate cyclase (GGDEF)-like protein
MALSRAVPVRNAAGEIVEWFGPANDITDRKLAEQRKEAHGAMLFIDLDRFKPIIDLYGHHTGDKVLQQVGKRLVAATRTEDLVGRLAGDEFVILLTHLERLANEAYSLEARLKSALAQARFALHYQPVVDIKNGRLTGVEALARLADDSNPPVGPDVFIPIAESAGLINDLGEWVLRETCRQHEAWFREGMQINIAVNVSPLQFHREFPEVLRDILAETGVALASLQLEVIGEGIESEDALRYLKHHGCNQAQGY